MPGVAGAVRAEAFRSIEALEHGGVSCSGDRVDLVGDVAEADVDVDASGCTVVPGFVDAHSYLPLPQSTRGELHRVGPPSERVVAAARPPALASDSQLVSGGTAAARRRLMLGITTFELKTGYALTSEEELRHLAIAAGIGRRIRQRVVPTCFAAHVVPPGRSQGDWIGEVSSALLPEVAGARLAAACDISIESFSFALEHAARLAEACRSLGLRLRVHADRYADNQTGSFAARWGLATADHLNHTSIDAVYDLAGSDTAAVLVPGAGLSIRHAMLPPARALVDAGAIVALGSGFGPGDETPSMLAAMGAARRDLHLTGLEALAAATVNAAYALGVDREVGRLAHGFRADIVLLEGPDSGLGEGGRVAVVVCGGELVYTAPGNRHRVRRS